MGWRKKCLRVGQFSEHAIGFKLLPKHICKQNYEKSTICQRRNILGRDEKLKPRSRCVGACFRSSHLWQRVLDQPRRSCEPKPMQISTCFSMKLLLMKVFLHWLHFKNSLLFCFDKRLWLKKSGFFNSVNHCLYEEEDWFTTSLPTLGKSQNKDTNF